MTIYKRVLRIAQDKRAELEANYAKRITEAKERIKSGRTDRRVQLQELFGVNLDLFGGLV